MILFVTSNEHKFTEISKLMEDSGHLIKWKNLKYEEIQADTTSEISLDSAMKIMAKLGEDFFLEDTGLYVDSLDGFPGPYSSFVAATIGNEGILRLVAGKDRTAKFQTVITYCVKGICHQFEGILEGRIADSISGKGGFGFDPIFMPAESEKTLAEMSTAEKNSISHRAKALLKLMQFLDSQEQKQSIKTDTDEVK